MRSLLVMTPAHISAIESLPMSIAERRADIWTELETLDSLILRKGPSEPDVRAHIRTRAEVVCGALAISKPSKVSDGFLLARARELLRDLGTEGVPTARSLRAVFAHARAPVRFFQKVRDFPNLGRSLIALANVYRLANDERRANQQFRWAFHILHEECDSRDPAVARLQHQVSLWCLRNKIGDQSRTKSVSEMKRLTDLAGKVDDPFIWTEHYREEAAFKSRHFRDFEGSAQSIRKMKSAHASLKNHTAWADLTLLTPQIMLHFEGNSSSEAERLIFSDYAPLYHKYPNALNQQRLVDWGKKYNFNVAPPLFGSAFLSYLPRRTNELSNLCDNARS